MLGCTNGHVSGHKIHCSDFSTARHNPLITQMGKRLLGVGGRVWGPETETMWLLLGTGMDGGKRPVTKELNRKQVQLAQGSGPAAPPGLPGGWDLGEGAAGGGALHPPDMGPVHSLCGPDPSGGPHHCPEASAPATPGRPDPRQPWLPTSTHVHPVPGVKVCAQASRSSLLSLWL